MGGRMLPRPPLPFLVETEDLMTVPNATHEFVGALSRRETVALIRCQFPAEWRAIAATAGHTEARRFLRAMLQPIAEENCRCAGRLHRPAC